MMDNMTNVFSTNYRWRGAHQEGHPDVSNQYSQGLTNERTSTRFEMEQYLREWIKESAERLETHFPDRFIDTGLRWEDENTVVGEVMALCSAEDCTCYHELFVWFLDGEVEETE